MSDTGLIDEHQSRTVDASTGAIYEPSPDERKVIKLVERVFEKNKRHRAQYDGKWLEFYRLFRGQQWKEARPSYRHSEVINFIFRTIQSLVPIQTDARPRFGFLPQEPTDFPLSHILAEMAESDWQRKNWQETLLEVVYDANIYSTGLSEVCVDEKTGEPVYKSVNPFHCFPDPDARDTNKECGSFITAVPTDVSKVKRKYPDKADYIKPDLLDLMKGSKTDLSPIKFKSPTDNKIYLEGSSSTEALDKDKALVITCWLSPEFCEDEYDEKENVLRDAETGEEHTEYVQIARFPQGRKVVICNGILLEDGPNPYEDGKIPFQRLPNYLLPREFWGISEVEQIEGPQRMFNKVFCFALDVLTLMGNPIWVVDDTSGVDPDNLINRPGLVVEKNKDSEVRREEGVQLQPYVLQIADRLAQWVDSVSGSQDVTRGVQPTGVTAASAISQLQESANTRIRLKTRLQDGYLNQVGQAWAARVFQFQTADKVYRLTNDQGASKYFRVSMQPTQMAHPQTGMPVDGKSVHYQPYTDSGQIDPTQAMQYQTQGMFDVRVSSDSSLPFNKAEKEQRLLNFFDRGIVDAEEVLRGTEYPNYEAVLQRIMQKQAEQAQMQAQQGQNSAPPPAA